MCADLDRGFSSGRPLFSFWLGLFTGSVFCGCFLADFFTYSSKTGAGEACPELSSLLEIKHDTSCHHLHTAWSWRNGQDGTGKTPGTSPSPESRFSASQRAVQQQGSPPQSSFQAGHFLRQGTWFPFWDQRESSWERTGVVGLLPPPY